MEKTLALEVLKQAGIKIKRPGEPGWEDFRKYWYLGKDGEGSGFTCPSSANQNVYLTVGNDDDYVEVYVTFSHETDSHQWSQWGNRFATWCDEHWQEVLNRKDTTIIRHKWENDFSFDNYLLEEISNLQSKLSRVAGYANHTTEGVNGILGTCHALGELGYLSDEELEAVVIVGQLILEHSPK